MAPKTDTKKRSKVIEDLVEALSSKVFKALSEPVRAEILKFLLIQGRSDIGTIAMHLPQDRSVISRHLTLMADAGIVSAEKESRHVFYEINAHAFLQEFEGIVEHIKKCIRECYNSDNGCKS